MGAIMSAGNVGTSELYTTVPIRDNMSRMRETREPHSQKEPEGFS